MEWGMDQSGFALPRARPRHNPALHVSEQVQFRNAERDARGGASTAKPAALASEAFRPSSAPPTIPNG
jgi:hypothetical protein